MPLDVPNINWLEVFPNNENANNVLNAILALISVLASHDIIEGAMIRCAGLLHLDTVYLLHIMRSHSSPSQMYALWRAKLFHRSMTHKLGCRCLSQYRRLILKTVVVRVLILTIELLAIFMAMSQSWPFLVQHGSYAVVLASNKHFGKPVNLVKGEEDCQELLKLPRYVENSSEVDRQTKFVACTVSHAPSEAPHNMSFTLPPGFISFFIYIHISGDKVTFSSANGSIVGSELYAYVTSDGLPDRLLEGPIATIVYGANYDEDRGKKLNASETKAWQAELDAYLKNKMKDGYASIYEQDTQNQYQPVPRMLLSFNFAKLAKNKDLDIPPCDDMHSPCAIKAVVNLLQHIVQIQRKETDDPRIYYSGGVRMAKTETEAVWYTVKRPLIGSVPWIIILSFILLIRAIFSHFYPNKLYPVVLDLLRNLADEDGNIDMNNYWIWIENPTALRQMSFLRQEYMYLPHLDP